MPELRNSELSDDQIKKLMHSDAYKETMRNIFTAVQIALPAYRDSIPPMQEVFDKLTNIIDPRYASITIGPEGHELYSDYLNFCNGNKTYELHQNLITKLRVTNIKSVPTECLRLPFKTILLKTPKGAAFFKAFNGVNYDVEEIILSELPEFFGYGNAIKIFVRSAPYNCYFTILLSEDEVHKCVDKTIEMVSESPHKKEVDEERMRIIKETTHIPEDMKAEYLEVVKTNSEFTDENKIQIRGLFEFIMKCILYINGANADVYWYDENDYLQAKIARAKSTKKIRKLQSMIRKSGVFRVGHRIVLSREERLMYDNISTGKWKVSAKFIVQGHYRSQPYGEGRQKRKIIFIEPFYKGEEFSEIINKEHIVK